jgi:hypothetical protein
MSNSKKLLMSNSADQSAATLLLTATINVSANKNNIIVSDPQVRLQQYTESLIKWIQDQDVLTKIVFIENSGFDLGQLSNLINKITHTKVVEFISFHSECDMNHNDIGFGEMEMIKTALDQSKIIDNMFYKCTGRVYIRNIKNLNLNSYDILGNFRNNLVNMDSVFFGMRKGVFIDDVYEILFNEIENGGIFEHGLAMGVHKAILNKKRWSPIVPEIYIDGFSGATGEHYMKNNPFYFRVVRNIANYLFYRGAYTYYKDGSHYYELIDKALVEKSTSKYGK